MKGQWPFLGAVATTQFQDETDEKMQSMIESVPEELSTHAQSSNTAVAEDSDMSLPVKVEQQLKDTWGKKPPK